MHSSTRGHVGLSLAAMIVLAGTIAGACQETITAPRVLLERSGTGSASLPAFTSRGTYDVAYSYGQCPGLVTGLTIVAHDGPGTSPATLLQTAAPTGSGDVPGSQPGSITLEIDTKCQWKITVKG